jgi:hypothetical protein
LIRFRSKNETPSTPSPSLWLPPGWTFPGVIGPVWRDEAGHVIDACAVATESGRGFVVYADALHEGMDRIVVYAYQAFPEDP